MVAAPKAATAPPSHPRTLIRCADYVSQTDVAAQEPALAVIRRGRPDHLVLAEETDESV